MASVRREVHLSASPEAVWDALRDFGAVHERVVRGFAVDTQVEGNARTVTFANGTQAREVLVGLDDDARRIAYAVIDARLQHHSAMVQVSPDGESGSCVTWITDVLPDEVAGYIGQQMDAGALAMQATLGRPLEV